MSRTGANRITALVVGAIAFPLLATPAASGPIGPTRPNEPAAVLTRVDGEDVTTFELDVLLASQKKPEPGEAAVHGLTPDGLLKRLIQNRLLEQEGYRVEAEKDPQIRNQVWDLVRHRGMMALLDSVSADVPRVDEALEEAMEQEHVMNRVAHLLVPDESFARSLLDSLASGADFGDLAARHSLDTTRAEAGGDLGWAREDGYVPAFRDVIAGLEKGEVGGPVESEAGWHLLRLTDTRIETTGQSDPMKDAIREATIRKRVMKRVRDYVASLREKYGVAVDDSLLASLDYSSTDPEVVLARRSNDAVLVTLPWRTLTVAALDRQIRFKHFHGIDDKPDPAAIRDKVLDEWVTEILLRHEAGELGFGERPEIVRAAQWLERDLIRDHVVRMVLGVSYEPELAEVEKYWAEHRDEFTPAPKIRADGVLLADEESAREFRSMIEGGAKMKWMAERTPAVRNPDPAFLGDWLPAEALALGREDVVKGALIGPVPSEGAWLVARIQDVEVVGPTPLDQCMNAVIGRMTGEMRRDTMRRALERLESEADIEVVEGARELIADRIEAWLGTPAAAGSR